MSDQPATIRINGTLVDPSLLESLPIRRCDIRDCQGTCCTDGVWVDLGQAQRIAEQADLIAPFLPPERRDPSRWFDELHEDADMPSGRYTGTTLVKDPSHPHGETCVFLRPEDRYCAIQAACVADGRPAWDLKPYYCCLFPLVDEHEGGTRRLMLDSDNPLFERGGGCHAACEQPQVVFQVYAEETALGLGVEGYRELCKRVGIAPKALRA